MIKVTAKCILIEGKKEEFKVLVKELIYKTREENGCISYDLYEDMNNENIVTFIEEWNSKEDLDNHMKSEHFIAIVPELRKLQIEDSIVNLYKK